MRALVTGAEGFIGRHLVKVLKEKGYKVYAACENETDQADADERVICDVRQMRQVNDAVGKSLPEVIYHMAAQSYPTLSWEKPQQTLIANAVGTANLFESVIRHDIDPVVVVACSSAEYGYVSKDEVPVTESHKLEPLHPYGVSKVAQDLLAYQYYRNNGVKSVRARIFNTTGPGKVKDVVSEFAKRVAKFEKGTLDAVRHGNLDARRDITDVRDMVDALSLCEKVEYGQAYNLCSMRERIIGDLLDKLVAMSDVKVETRKDIRLLRTTDEPVILGDNTKFVGKTGWKPKISIEKTLEDTLNYWRERV